MMLARIDVAQDRWEAWSWPLRIGAASVALVFASACSSSSDADRRNSETRVQARQAVTALLRDAQSAEFSDMAILESAEGHRVVCGKVSARDGWGDVAGPQRFITNGAELTVLEEQASLEKFDAAWFKICT